MSFARLFRRRRTPKAHAPRARLFLEPLEARDLLSAYLVDRLTDVNPTSGGEGSDLTGDLRYAMTNAQSGDDITFSVTGTINPAAFLPNLTQNVSIDGPGANQLTVNAAFRVFSGATVTLSGLSIGGGTYNAGTLTLSNDTVSGGQGTHGSDGGGDGGGLYNATSGTLTVNSSTISGNTAHQDQYSGGGDGGGIYNAGTLTLTNSTVADNYAFMGGGIFNVGTVTLNDDTLAQNKSTLGGGAEEAAR